MSKDAVHSFQGERLAQALDARRLSQVQLARMAGVSPATVSKWRAGTHAPSTDALERLARVINVSAEWFTRPLLAPTSAPMFRSNASAHTAARAMLGARVQWAQDLASALAHYVDWPALNLPDYGFTEPEAITAEDVERAAAHCRSLWKLGSAPIADLTLAAEGAGIIVVREVTGAAQIEGLSAWSSALERPIALLSADKENAYRSRFDLAHEIGHIVLHRHIERASERDRYRLLEKQAHYFAGALLLPAEAIAAQTPDFPTLDDLLPLKRRWGTSVAAIIMRLKAIGFLGEDETRALFKRRSARWGAKAEPGDDQRAPECPRLLRRAIESIAGAGIMPTSAMPDYTGMRAGDIESLASLPDGWLLGTIAAPKLVHLKPRTGSAPRNSGGATIMRFSRTKAG